MFNRKKFGQQMGLTDFQVDRIAGAIEEMDRNARAYGWECGKAGVVLGDEFEASEDNPFMNPNWREAQNEE